MDSTATRPLGIPTLGKPTPAILRQALVAGWQDFRAAPAFGLIVAVLCLVAGWGLVGLTVWAGHTFWFVLGVFGFPLAAPFAALQSLHASRHIFFNQFDVRAVEAKLPQHVVKKHAGVGVSFYQRRQIGQRIFGMACQANAMGLQLFSVTPFE